MSSLEEVLHSPSVQVEYNTANGPMNQVDNEMSEVLLNKCLDALMYQNAELRPPTHSTLRLIEDAKSKLGEANASLIEGIRMFKFDQASFKWFAKAEEKGCKHPALYYFMGMCYADGGTGVDKDDSKTLEYYDMTIAGGCGWGLSGRYNFLSDRSGSRDKESFQYLLDLEGEGHIDGSVFNMIGKQYSYSPRYPEGQAMAMMYYQRSIDDGFARAAVDICYLLYPHVTGTHAQADKAVLSLLESEHKGLGLKDDCILDELVKILTDFNDEYYPNPDILGSFQSKSEMALHYCDVLIQRKSPLGYKNKADIYEHGLARVGKDMSKAVSIWKEAINEGLANYDICYALQKAYRDGHGVPVNGLRALEYCEKALQVLNSNRDVRSIFGCMANVYEKGLEPVKKDGKKMLECYERALHIAGSVADKAAICTIMANAYVKGFDSVSPSGVKALEYYIKALEYHNKALQFGAMFILSYIYNGIASVYETGISPIAQNLDKSAELRQTTGRRE